MQKLEDLNFVTKTKSLRVDASKEAPIAIHDQAIWEVDRFTYLGSIVSKTGGTDEDVKARINKAPHETETV